MPAVRIEEGHAEAAARPGHRVVVAVPGRAVLALDGTAVLVVILLELDGFVGGPGVLVDRVEPQFVDDARLISSCRFR